MLAAMAAEQLSLEGICLTLGYAFRQQPVPAGDGETETSSSSEGMSPILQFVA